MEIKFNDVYKFRFNEEYIKKTFEPYWCFDAQLIVKQDRNGELYLADTYWGFNDGENKSFTLEQALERGTLTFVCNLDDVEKCKEYDLYYYAEEDLFDLSYQSHCYKAYYKRKGAKKSIEKMKRIVQEKIECTEHDISWKQSELIKLKEKLEELDSGNIDVYI